MMMMNDDIAILEAIQLCAKKSSISFKNVVFTVCLQIMYIFNTYV